ncbi:hypothetical protein U9M48_002113, partial [Paspalum notatum var. saurae]
PLELGGLGVHNLEVLGWSKIRWLWAQKTDPDRPWAAFNISIPPKAKALFDVAMVSVVGNDRWLQGKTVGEVAPSLLKAVLKRTANCRTVAQALHNRAWASDFVGAFTVQFLVEFLQLWDVVEEVTLGEGPDQHLWKFTQSGCYTSKSAYSAFFEGSIKFRPWRLIWKSWAPHQCKFFLWLAKNNRCWTADRLAKRGLPYPDACPLCDQADETLQHILIGCVFSRQIWALILQSLQLADITPTMADSGFFSWWAPSVKSVPKNIRKGLSTLCILVAWEIWKFRNLCVLEGLQPNVQLLLHRIGSEGIFWCAARASGLLELLNRSLTLATRVSRTSCHGRRRGSSGRPDGPRTAHRQAPRAAASYGRWAAATAGDASTRGCGNGNFAFSPVSVHAALALAAAAARGATLAQLLAFLGAPSAEGLAGFSRRVAGRVLADRSRGTGAGPRVLFGGGVWVDESRGRLADAFRDVAADVYKSEARTPEAAVEMINEWVKKATDNLIGSIISVDDINGDVDLVLANAVYFKGAWHDPFRTSTTRRGAFHRLDGAVAEPEFMTGSKWLDIACMDEFKVLKLPYKPGVAPYAHAWAYLRMSHLKLKRKRKRRRGLGAASKSKAAPSPEAVDEVTRYSMFVFLPDARDGLSAMVDVVTALPAFLYGVLGTEMKTRLVDITLPKFEISFRWGDLKRDLGRLGLSLPFSREAADLRGMMREVEEEEDDDSARRPTFLSKVAHMAVVKVDEAGTEAAAVTAAQLYGAAPPTDAVEFVADHPFTFFIMEELSGVIVFAGHVLDPTK